PTSLAGSAVVVGGLALSGLGGRRGGGAGRRGALGWAGACAMSIAGYHLAYQAGLREAGNPSACFALSLAGSATLHGGRRVGAGRRAREATGALLRRRWPRLLVMGIVCSASFLILMEALARGGSGYVLTLRNTSVLFAVAMAWRIGERPGRAEVAGAALVAAG